MSKPPFLVLPSDARAYRLRAGARGEFAVHDAGEPRRGTALLVPGFTGSKEDFIALLGPLAEAGFRAVAVDNRGQYETGGPAEAAAYAQQELAADVAALVEAVRGPDGGPVHLLGHSHGGQVARAAVLAAEPLPLASLTLLSSGPAAVCAAQQERLGMLLDALAAMPMEAVWEAMQQLEPPQSGLSPEVGAFLRRRWLANVPAQLLAAGRQLLTEPDRVAELAEVSAARGLPLHAVSGEIDDAWPVAWLDEMARRLGARRTVIAGAGHSPNADRPADTARALADFWGSVQGTYL